MEDFSIALSLLVLVFVTQGIKLAAKHFGLDLSGYKAQILYAAGALVTVYGGAAYPALVALVPAELQSYVPDALAALVLLLGGKPVYDKFVKPK